MAYVMIKVGDIEVRLTRFGLQNEDLQKLFASIEELIKLKKKNS